MNIEQCLEQYRGREVWFKPNPGNGGDALIAYTALRLFEKMNIKVHLVHNDDDLTDKIVFYGGGGNFVEMYRHCSSFVTDNHKKVKQLIILPQTIDGHASLLSELGENVTIFCREKTSFEYVTSMVTQSHVYLVQDLVFSIDIPNDFLQFLSANRLYTLVKFRRMVGAILRKENRHVDFLKSWKNKSFLNAFRIDVEATSITLPSDNIDVTSLINLDYSMKNVEKVNKTTLRIFSFLNQFSEINTNRLHVCIAGAILGKKVNFYSNSYHKNESIYKHSIRNKFPNVVWHG